MKNPAAAAAPDSSVATRDDDVLGRWPIARTIYDLIRHSPPEWSLRIGVYGCWGEGKTSMLRFVETLAKEDGQRPIRFNPWRALTRDELWTQFSRALERELNLKPSIWIRISVG